VKTISLKKVAVVAVASLGFGLLSVVPANAAANAAQNAYIADTTTVNVASAGAVTLATGQAGVSYTKNTAVAATAVSSITAPASSVIAFVATAGNGGTWTASTEAKVKINGALRASNLACTITTVTCVLANFTAPATAGTYAMEITFGSGASFAIADLPETVALTLVVTAGPTWSQGATTTYMVDTADTLPTSTTDLEPIGVSSALGTYAGTILVSVKSTTGAAYTGQTVEAIVSGVGFVGGSSATYNATAATFATNIGTADGTAVTTRSKSVSDSTGYVAFAIWGDGQAGTSTVTIKVTDQITSATTTIATKTVTFFGAVTKLAVDKSNYTIGKAGSETGKAATARTLAGEVTNAGALNASTTTPAFVIKATDAGGNAANTAANPTVVSSDYSVIGSGTCVKDDGSSVGVYSSGAGFGFYNCSFTAAQGAVSGSKATLTFRITDPTDTTKFLTATADVTVGGSVSTETITFDKATYAPGEAMVVTRTAKDSAGNPVADGSAAPALTFSKSVGGTAPGASTYVGGKRATSATAPTVFAPALGGAFTVTATSGNAAASALSASATVTDANAGLLTQLDALNAKIVALNALIAKIMKRLGVK